MSVAYVENVAAAHLQAERSLQQSPAISGRAYFINEPESVNLWDWVNTLLAAGGLPPLQRAFRGERQRCWEASVKQFGAHCVWQVNLR